LKINFIFRLGDFETMTSDYDYDRFYIRDEVSSSIEVVIVIVTSHCHILLRLLFELNLLIY
jgi:hypothetical protein